MPCGPAGRRAIERQPCEGSREISTPPQNRFAAVLTATIAPKDAVHLLPVRRDPGARMADYQEALRFWLRLHETAITDIVFAENSGADLSPLEEVVREESSGRCVEFLSYDEPPPPEGLHYGYSEYQLFVKALRESGAAARTSHFIKATGRYRFPGISRLLRTVPADAAVYVDSRLARPLRSSRHFLTKFALAVFRNDFFFEHLADLPASMVPAPPWTRSQFVETVLFDRLEQLKSLPGVYRRWACNCEPLGIGGNGSDYSGLMPAAKRGVRALSRVILPDLWI